MHRRDQTSSAAVSREPLVELPGRLSHEPIAYIDAATSRNIATYKRLTGYYPRRSRAITTLISTIIIDALCEDTMNQP